MPAYHSILEAIIYGSHKNIIKCENVITGNDYSTLNNAYTIVSFSTSQVVPWHVPCLPTSDIGISLSML